MEYFSHVSGCYQEIYVDSEVGFISSPGYPDDYPPSTFCVWRLMAEEGERIRVRVLDSDFAESTDYCENDAFGVRTV